MYLDLSILDIFCLAGLVVVDLALFQYCPLPIFPFP